MGSKRSFVLYFDIRGPLEMLSDADRGKLFLALLDYAEHGTIPQFDDGAVIMAFAFIRNSIDRDAAAWAKKSEERAEAGRKGGNATAAKRANAGFAIQQEANQTNQAVPVPVPAPVPAPVNIEKTGKPSRAPRLIPPTVEDVAAYCRERANNVDPQAFVDHYTANGWMRGKTKIKDWRACVRTWETSSPKHSTQGKYYDYSDTEGSL